MLSFQQDVTSQINSANGTDSGPWTSPGLRSRDGRARGPGPAPAASWFSGHRIYSVYNSVLTLLMAADGDSMSLGFLHINSIFCVICEHFGTSESALPTSTGRTWASPWRADAQPRGQGTVPPPVLVPAILALFPLRRDGWSSL